MLWCLFNIFLDLQHGSSFYQIFFCLLLILCTAAFEGVDTVFHTAAANHTNNNFQLHYKVNVEG